MIKEIHMMKYDAGKQALNMLSNQVRNLSPQLYVQLYCQVNLMSSIILNGILYFVQRFPKSLGIFRWRIDQKNSTKTNYEDAFYKLTPGLLQSISFKEPLIMLEGADYSAFKRFDYPKGDEPTYLKTQYGIDMESHLNIGKIIHENIEFSDSEQNPGVQVVDLLASGLRRCLRKGFNNNQHMAELFGKLMVHGLGDKWSLSLLGFCERDIPVSSEVAELIKIMHSRCHPMLFH